MLEIHRVSMQLLKRPSCVIEGCWNVARLVQTVETSLCKLYLEMSGHAASPETETAHNHFLMPLFESTKLLISRLLSGVLVDMPNGMLRHLNVCSLVSKSWKHALQPRAKSRKLLFENPKHGWRKTSMLTAMNIGETNCCMKRACETTSSILISMHLEKTSYSVVLS